MSGMAHFPAPSNAVLPTAEEGGEFCGEVGGQIHVGDRKRLDLNNKVGNWYWILLLPDLRRETCGTVVYP